MHDSISATMRIMLGILMLLGVCLFYTLRRLRSRMKTRDRKIPSQLRWARSSSGAESPEGFKTRQQHE